MSEPTKEPLVVTKDNVADTNLKTQHQDGQNRDKGKKRYERRRRGGDRKLEVVQVDPIVEHAALVSATVEPQFRDILDNLDTTYINEATHEEEDLPDADWSFAATRKAIADNWLKLPKQEGEAQPDSEQTITDHSKTRQKIVRLVTEQFAAAMARVEAVISLAKIKANEKGNGDKVLQVRKGSNGRGRTLLQDLESKKRDLEWLRAKAIGDALAWFDARVDQVDRMMHTLTRRTSENTSVTARLRKLVEDRDFKGQLAQLEEDIKMFESFLSLAPETEQQVQARIASTVEKAKKTLVDFNEDKKRFLELGVKKSKKLDEDGNPVKDDRGRFILIPDEQGDTGIERAQKGLLYIFNDSDIGKKFIAEAEARLVGLSPQEEANFWQSVQELFNAVGGDIAKDLKGQERQQARYDKLMTINRELGLFTIDGNRAFLNKVDEVQDPGKEYPNGFGQIVARCKVEAKMGDKLREELNQTLYSVGFDGRKAVQDVVRGRSNSTKIEALEALNKVLEAKKSEAFKQLTTPQTEQANMDDAVKQAVAAANDVITQFNAELKGRTLDKLRWKNEADRPLITKVRAKMLELVGIKGDVKSAESKAILRELLFPAPVAEAGSTEKREESTTPWIERLKTGDWPAAEIYPDEQDANIAEEYKKFIVDNIKFLNDAVLSAPVRKAFLDQTVLWQSTELTAQSIKGFAQRLTALVEACQTVKQTFKDNWRKDFGVWQPDPKGGNKGLANTDVIIRIMAQIKDGRNPLAALLEVGQAAAEAAGKKAIFEKQAQNLGAVEERLPVEAEASEAVEPNVLKEILAGKVDAASLTEAYPQATPEQYKQDIEAYLDTIAESASQAVRDAIIENGSHITKSDMSVPEKLKFLAEKLSEIGEFFISIQSNFDNTWPSELGLVVPDPHNPDQLVANNDFIKEVLNFLLPENSVIDAFAFDVTPIVQEKLGGKVDQVVDSRFSQLEIPVPDQLYFTFLTMAPEAPDTLPDTQTCLKRLVKCMELSARKKKGEVLLKYLHLKRENGDYEKTEILEIMDDSSFDQES